MKKVIEYTKMTDFVPVSRGQSHRARFAGEEYRKENIQYCESRRLYSCTKY